MYDMCITGSNFMFVFFAFFGWSFLLSVSAVLLFSPSFFNHSASWSSSETGAGIVDV